MRIKGVEFRRGFFRPDHFPHLRLASQVLASVARFNGTGVRMCSGVQIDERILPCNRWMPYMCKETEKWHEIRTLEYLDRHIFKGLDLKASHGICPECFVEYDKHLKTPIKRR